MFRPSMEDRFVYQLSGKVNTKLDFDVFIIEWDTPQKVIDELLSMGKKPIAYFSSGTYESWREDAKRFTKDMFGSKMDGWDEIWLDIRKPEVLEIMDDRLDIIASKGFVGVDPDNTDAYDNKGGGLKLTAKDSASYLHKIIGRAHKKGLCCGIKNSLDILYRPSVFGIVDFAVNEQAAEYDEADVYNKFLEAEKPVFCVEYKSSAYKKEHPQGMWVVRQDMDSLTKVYESRRA